MQTQKLIEPKLKKVIDLVEKLGFEAKVQQINKEWIELSEDTYIYLEVSKIKTENHYYLLLGAIRTLTVLTGDVYILTLYDLVGQKAVLKSPFEWK